MGVDCSDMFLKIFVDVCYFLCEIVQGVVLLEFQVVYFCSVVENCVQCVDWVFIFVQRFDLSVVDVLGNYFVENGVVEVLFVGEVVV